MASFYIAQAGTTLIAVQTNGTIATLTLPSGVSFVATRRPSFATLGRQTVLTNSPTRNLWIDTDRNVRVMNLNPPNTAPVLTAVGTGALSGTFQVKTTFLVIDPDSGELLQESPFGPTSTASAVLASNLLRANGIPISQDSQVNARRLYRTTTGPGTTFYPWLDVEGNTITDVRDDLPDSGLSLVAAPTDLGNPPGAVGSSRLEFVTSWRGRLWGKDGEKPDDVVFSGEGKFYAWSAVNRLTIPPKGKDLRGVTAFAPRRDALGIGRVDALHQLTGTSLSNFAVVRITENVGVESAESVVIFRDTAHFLWKDGVYKWGSDGVDCISDGKVRSWFATDNYFNRGRFQNAFARVDPLRNTYQLFLASAGSSVEDRWVEYNFDDKTWWGPHKSDALTPTCAATLLDSNDAPLPVIGSSSGYLWQNQSTRTDHLTPIDFDVDTKFHDMQTPDIEKYFGELALISKVQSAGTLTITPYVGGLDAAAGVPLFHHMTLGRERLGRIGTGRFVKFNFRHQLVAGEDVELYGYEIPFHELGRR